MSEKIKEFCTIKEFYTEKLWLSEKPQKPIFATFYCLVYAK